MSDKPGIDGPLTARQLMWILYAPAVISAVLWLILANVPIRSAPQGVATTGAAADMPLNNAEMMSDDLEAAADRAMANSGL